MDFHLFNINDIVYLSFHCFSKKFVNGYYWSKMVQYGSKLTLNTKMPKIVQNSVVQIIGYSNIFKHFGQYIHSQKLSLIFSRANLFGYSFVILLSCKIYSDIHSSNIYSNKYIPIFICPKQGYLSHTEINIFG